MDRVVVEALKPVASCASQYGHKLHPWSYRDGSWFSACRSCGCWVEATVLDGTAWVEGSAVELECAPTPTVIQRKRRAA